MDDVALLTTTKAVLDALLPDGWRAVQNYQASGQARHDTPTVYFQKMGDRPVGFPSRKEVWNPTAGHYDQVQTQLMEATVRLQGFAPEDAPETTVYSADVAARASLVLQSDLCVAMFRQAGGAPLRVRNLPAVAVQDERDAWERVVAFDFVVSYSRAIVIPTPSAAIGDVSTYPV